MSDGLRYGPLGREACLVAIDMQVYFAQDSEWATTETLRILPVVERLAAHAPARTIFTRFMPPHTASEAPGVWQAYYRRWSSVLRQNNDMEVYGLLPPLQALVPPAHVTDKSTYSAFESAAFTDLLGSLGCTTLILAGVETEACVFATVLAAVDRGLRTVMVRDAIASSSPASHTGILDTLVPRYGDQIELVSSSTILERWKP